MKNLYKEVPNFKPTASLEKKIPITDFNTLDMHRLPDTILAQFFMRVEKIQKTDKNYEEGASFIGQCHVPFKQCFAEDNIGKYLKYQVSLKDPEGKAYDTVSGSVILRCRFIPLGKEGSSFNADGSKKKEQDATEQAGVAKVSEQRLQDRKKVAGAAGVLHIKPMFCIPQGGFKFAVDGKYTIQYKFEETGEQSMKSLEAIFLPDNGQIKFIAEL